MYYGKYEVHGADVNTFVDLGMGWGKDKDDSYHNVHKLYECDSNTLQPMNEFYAKDISKVFFRNYSSIENLGGFSLMNGSLLMEHICNFDSFIMDEPKEKVEENLSYA